MFYPKFLKTGCKIGVTACSDGNQDPLDFIRVDSAKLHLEERGYQVVETPNVRTSEKGRSSSAAERAEQFHSLLMDEDVRLIVMAKGGDYLAEVLPRLDFETMKRHPKWIQGYSDPTGLLFTVTTRCDIATVYASNFGDFGMAEWHKSIQDNIELLEGKAVMQTSFEKYMNGFAVRETGLEGYDMTVPVCWKNLNGENRVSVEGRLIGGCLDVLINLVGTRFDTVKEFVERYKDDKILWYLESFALNSEQLNLALWQLKEAGWFEHAAGFVFGRPCFYHSDYELDYAEVIQNALEELDVPIILDADFGHKPPRMAIINGAIGRFVCDGGRGSLTMRMSPGDTAADSKRGIHAEAEVQENERTESAPSLEEKEAVETDGAMERRESEEIAGYDKSPADETSVIDLIEAEPDSNRGRTGSSKARIFRKRKATEQLNPEEEAAAIKKKSGIRQYLPLLWFPLLFLYLEFVFHVLNFESLGKNMIFPVLFALPFGMLAQAVTGLFRGRGKRAVLWILSAGTVLIFAVQYVYYYIFRTFLVLYSVGAVGTDVLEFRDQIVNSIIAKLSGLLLLVALPLAVLGVLCHFGVFGKGKESGRRGRSWKWQEAIVGGAAVGLYLLVLGLLPLGGNTLYSAYDLYHKNWIQDMGTEKLGLITASLFDVKQLIFGSEKVSFEDLPTLNPSENASEEITQPEGTTEIAQGTTQPGTDITGGGGEEEPTPSPTPQVTVTPTPTPVDRSPNVMDIDFAALAKEETNQNIRNLHEYFASVEPTNKNEYTGIFEGYNLILLTAEGFSPWAVDEELTPTLYKLTHEGFVFNNFYTSLWWTSTSDGEYVACTGLIPSGSNSMKKSADHSLPFCLGWQFARLGYTSRAYHNHTYTYYGRDKTHPNMGYDYKGVGNGLELQKTWPESDLEMMAATIPEYINDEQFHVYYMTVSGHMEYTFTGNSMASKNRDAVADLPYSTEAKAYIACNIELDKALERLIADLEEAGIADKTVIALSADHYPYGLEKEKLDELAGHTVEENFELYENHFILWCAGMEETIEIDKPCSSLDILPTLSNLFGLEYDSRLLLGRDILSDSDPLVIFSNRSFITDKVMYNSKTGEVIKLTEEELPENYVKTISAAVNAKFTAGAGILSNDYYSVLPLFEEDTGLEKN